MRVASAAARDEDGGASKIARHLRINSSARKCSLAAARNASAATRSGSPSAMRYKWCAFARSSAAIEIRLSASSGAVKGRAAGVVSSLLRAALGNLGFGCPYASKVTIFLRAEEETSPSSAAGECPISRPLAGAGRLSWRQGGIAWRFYGDAAE